MTPSAPPADTGTHPLACPSDGLTMRFGRAMRDPDARRERRKGRGVRRPVDAPRAMSSGRDVMRVLQITLRKPARRPDLVEQAPNQG